MKQSTSLLFFSHYKLVLYLSLGYSFEYFPALLAHIGGLVLAHVTIYIFGLWRMAVLAAFTLT